MHTGNDCRLISELVTKGMKTGKSQNNNVSQFLFQFFTVLLTSIIILNQMWFTFHFFACFNNISVILRRSVLLVEETGGPLFNLKILCYKKNTVLQYFNTVFMVLKRHFVAARTGKGGYCQPAYYPVVVIGFMYILDNRISHLCFASL